MQIWLKRFVQRNSSLLLTYYKYQFLLYLPTTTHEFVKRDDFKKNSIPECLLHFYDK